jgi:hypothetical protein
MSDSRTTSRSRCADAFKHRQEKPREKTNASGHWRTPSRLNSFKLTVDKLGSRRPNNSYRWNRMLGNQRVAFLADLLAIIEQYSGEKLHDIDIVDVSSGQYHRQSILNWLTSELTTHDSRLARDQAGHLLYGSNSRLREAKSTIGENVATVERESQETVPHDTEDVDDEVKYAPKEPEPPYSDPFDPGPRQTDWDRKHCSNIDSRDCEPYEYPPSTETPKTPNDIVVTYGVDGRAKQRCRGNVEWTTKVTALRNIDLDPPAPLWLTNKEKTATGSIGGRHLRGPVPKHFFHGSSCQRMSVSISKTSRAKTGLCQRGRA